MPDLVVTAAQVLPVAGASFATKNAAVAITAGQAVYANASDQWALADNDVSAALASAVGIALNSAAAGQPVQAVISGDVTIGAAAAPAVAEIYCVSSTPGGICPYSDLGSNDYVTILGWGKATNVIHVNIIITGVQKP